MSNIEPDRDDALFGEVIHRYTRAQAIADGILIDVSTTATEAGFRWPVAMTHAAWLDCVEWTTADNAQQGYQDESGRLWDVLFMAAHAARTTSQQREQLLYSLYRVPRDGQSRQAHLTKLKLMLSAGDEGEPVMTLLLPHEE